LHRKVETEQFEIPLKRLSVMWRTMFFCNAVLCVMVPTTFVSAQGDILAELYGNGVHAYFAGQNRTALDALNAAIDAGSQDPRAYYFRGLTRLRLAQDEQAEADFTQGAALETGDSQQFYDVSASLSRIQGRIRLQLERYRNAARVVARQRNNEYNASRFGSNVAPATGSTNSFPLEDAGRPFLGDEEVTPPRPNHTEAADTAEAEPMPAEQPVVEAPIEPMPAEQPVVEAPIEPMPVEQPVVESPIEPTAEAPDTARPSTTTPTDDGLDPFGESALPEEPDPGVATPASTEPADDSADPAASETAPHGDPFPNGEPPEVPMTPAEPPTTTTPADDPFAVDPTSSGDAPAATTPMPAVPSVPAPPAGDDPFAEDPPNSGVIPDDREDPLDEGPPNSGTIPDDRDDPLDEGPPNSGAIPDDREDPLDEGPPNSGEIPAPDADEVEAPTTTEEPAVEPVPGDEEMPGEDPAPADEEDPFADPNR
jgi:hypothetical protein